MTNRQLIFKGNTIGSGEDTFQAKMNAKNKTQSLIYISFTEKYREKHDQLKQTFPPENQKKNS